MEAADLSRKYDAGSTCRLDRRSNFQSRIEVNACLQTPFIENHQRLFKPFSDGHQAKRDGIRGILLAVEGRKGQ